MKRLLIISFLALSGFAGLSSQEIFRLFVSFDRTKSLSLQDRHMPYKRIIAVELNPRLWSTTNYNVDDKLIIDLFDDDSHSSTIDRIDENVNGTVTIRARLDDYPMGYFLLSVTGDHVLGSIRIPENSELYRIKTDAGTGDTWLKSIDIPKLDFIEPGPPVIPPMYPEMSDQQLKRLKNAARQNPGDPASISVMIVYTPAAALWAGNNEGSVQNTIAQAMARAQLALDNSDAVLNLTLVHSAQVSYTESGDSNTDLERLTYHSGFDPFNREGTPRYLEEVHELREEYRADLVSLFSTAEDVGGLGWLLTLKRGSPEFGFSITRVQQASWTYTHIHEVGHNIGCHHHAGQNTSAGPTPWQDWSENTWSAGWRWQGNDDNTYSSLMTYSDGQFFSDGIDAITVPYFSNPGIYYAGSPAGNSLNGDNTRTIREIKHVIAAYQVSVPEYSLTIATEGNGNVSVDGTLYSQPLSVKEGDQLALRAIAGEGYELINWTGSDGNEIFGFPSYTFTMPPADISLTATFEPVDYTVTVNINPMGAGNTINGGTYNMDDEVTLEISANRGYMFINWTGPEGSRISDDYSYTFTMPAGDVVFNANFRQADLVIFPNPATSWFDIISSAGIDEVKIFDLTGKMVYSVNINDKRVRIPADNFQTGIYIVSVNTGGDVRFERVMILK